MGDEGMLGVEILWVFGFFSIFSVPLVQVRRDGRGRRCGWMDGRGEVEEQHLLWVLDIMVQLRRTFWLTRHTKTPVLAVLRKGGYTNNWTLIPQLPQQPDGCKPDIQTKTSSTFSLWSLFFPALTTEAPLTHEFYPKLHVPDTQRSSPTQRELNF